MSANKTESDNKSISRDELKQRLQKLAKRDRAAVAVFATRCALRVLPFTAGSGNFDLWQKNNHKFVQDLFVACMLGLEYDSIDGEISVAAAAAFAAAVTDLIQLEQKIFCIEKQSALDRWST